MRKGVKDLTGLTVGYLTVTKWLGSHPRGALWEVRCACGVSKSIPSADLKQWQAAGRKASCGCKTKETISERNKTHGMTRHPAYGVYRTMRDRCANPKNTNWANYGGRGITVCARWAESFENFWADMGDTYQPGLTLDRNDTNGAYSKENCAWVTPVRNANNKRNNVLLGTPAGQMTVADAARHYGIGYETLRRRLRMWPLEEALGLSTTFRKEGRNRKAETKLLDTPKGPMTVAWAAREFGISVHALRGRLKNGWPLEKALNLSTT